MGRTPKPITILCHSGIAEWPEVQALAAQGHTVVIGPKVLVGDPSVIAEPDLILSPVAWRMDTQHRKYLKLAVEAARKVRYAK